MCQADPNCPGCGHPVPVVHSRTDPRERWARHTREGSLTSDETPECGRSGTPWAETLRERSWRERQEAKNAVDEALIAYSDQEMALNEARLAYRTALERERHAVQRDIDAWRITEGQ